MPHLRGIDTLRRPQAPSHSRINRLQRFTTPQSHIVSCACHLICSHQQLNPVQPLRQLRPLHFLSQVSIWIATMNKLTTLQMTSQMLRVNTSVNCRSSSYLISGPVCWLYFPHVSTRPLFVNVCITVKNTGRISTVSARRLLKTFKDFDVLALDS